VNDMYDYNKIVEDLLKWYDAHARDLPWRREPKPYYVWVSEIMLQQTRVEAVKGYFTRFIEALPNIEALANAPEEQLLKLWEGLGYYNRVRNLQKAAITVMEEFHGELPADYKELLTLKGIGTYTAGAIASIAYGIQVPAVDGNVLRVMKRLAGSYDDIMKASVKKEMEQTLSSVVPVRAGAFNQAIMDLGALVCIPNGMPLCEQCPLAAHCIAREKGIQLELPVKTKKKSRRIEEKTILLLEYQGKYAIQKRANKGLLAGLWELPSVEGKYSEQEIRTILKEENQQADIYELGAGQHIFSHIEWSMVGYHIILEKPIEEDTYVWATKQELQDMYAIPTAFSIYLKGCIS
jgi:A/G-specific adenine glycosylase